MSVAGLLLDYRGYSVILFAPLCALLAAVLEQPVHTLPFFSGIFMEKLAGFLKLYFPVFLTTGRTALTSRTSSSLRTTSSPPSSSWCAASARSCTRKVEPYLGRPLVYILIAPLPSRLLYGARKGRMGATIDKQRSFLLLLCNETQEVPFCAQKSARGRITDWTAGDGGGTISAPHVSSRCAGCLLRCPMCQSILISLPASADVGEICSLVGPFVPSTDAPYEMPDGEQVFVISDCQCGTSVGSLARPQRGDPHLADGPLREEGTNETALWFKLLTDILATGCTTSVGLATVWISDTDPQIRRSEEVKIDDVSDAFLLSLRDGVLYRFHH